MRLGKQKSGLLGLLALAAVGAMALAASAQAIAPGFLINGKAVGALLATVGAEQEGVSTMLVPGLNFKLSCTTVSVDEGAIESNTVAKVIFLHKGCSTLSISKSPEEIPCEVVEPIKTEALFLGAELIDGRKAALGEEIKGLLKLTKVGDLTKECILPFDNTVTGDECWDIVPAADGTSVSMETNATLECKERPTLGSLAEGAGVKDVLKYGAQTITLDSKVRLFLTGAHKGLSLGVALY